MMRSVKDLERLDARIDRSLLMKKYKNWGREKAFRQKKRTPEQYRQILETWMTGVSLAEMGRGLGLSDSMVWLLVFRARVFQRCGFIKL